MTEKCCSWIVIQQVQPGWSRFLRRKNKLATIVGEKKADACSATSVKVRHGFRWRFPPELITPGMERHSKEVNPSLMLLQISMAGAGNGVDGQLQRH
jgi:hypothetical protein